MGENSPKNLLQDLRTRGRGGWGCGRFQYLITHSCGVESRQPLYHFLGITAKTPQSAYLIARAAIWSSASLRRQRLRKQSDTAAIRYGLASCGREPMNSATDRALSAICRFCISLGIVAPLEKFVDNLFQIHHCRVLYQILLQRESGVGAIWGGGGEKSFARFSHTGTGSDYGSV